jgi:hypothetical protein
MLEIYAASIIVVCVVVYGVLQFAHACWSCSKQAQPLENYEKEVVALEKIDEITHDLKATEETSPAVVAADMDKIV